MEREKRFTQMRIEKLKTSQSISNYHKHVYRLYDNSPGVDTALSSMNKEIIPLEGKTYLDVLEQRLERVGYDGVEKKVRANNVLAIDVCCTLPSSLAKTTNIDEWVKDCLEFCRSEFNEAPDKWGDNILSCVLHQDEPNPNSGAVDPHLHIIIQPIDKYGNLNANKLCGNREAFTQRQDRFYSMVGSKHGMKRGRKKAYDKHRDKGHYKKERTQEYTDAYIPPLENEDIEEYAKRRTVIAIEELKNKNIEINKEKSRRLDETSRANLAEDKARKQAEEISLLRMQNEDLRGKADIYDLLQLGLKKHTNHNEAQRIAEDMNRMANIGKREREKQLEQ